jgi:uncharacterized protein (DUF1810 family)
MTGGWHELKKLIHLSGSSRFDEMRSAQLSPFLRVTPCGSYLWAPCDPEELGRSTCLDPNVWGADRGDVVMVFSSSKLKLVAVVLESIRSASTTYSYLARFGLRRSGCCMEVHSIYLAPHCAEDQEAYDQDSYEIVKPSEKVLPAFASVVQVSPLEQIRLAHFSDGGISLAHDELRQGIRVGEWTRWVFPSLTGAISSAGRNMFRLSRVSEALQLLRDPMLGANYLHSVELAWTKIAKEWIEPSVLMGSAADADELRSSVELFTDAWQLLDEEEKTRAPFESFRLHASDLLDVINPTL